MIIASSEILAAIKLGKKYFAIRFLWLNGVGSWYRYMTIQWDFQRCIVCRTILHWDSLRILYSLLLTVSHPWPPLPLLLNASSISNHYNEQKFS